VALASRSFRFSCGVLFAACLLVAIFVRIRFLEFPLERDEGEYAYAGQLLLGGIPPYQLAYNMKFPGTYVVYAAIMGLFGQSASAIHLGLLVINVATTFGVLVVGRQLANAEAGLIAGAFYAVLSLSPWVAGLCGHATHFVVLPVLIGTAMLLRRSVNFVTNLAAGALFGIAIVMKQPAALFLPFACVTIAFSRKPWKQVLSRIAIVLAGAFVPIALMALALAAAGTFARFKYWAIDYASAYGTLISPREGLRLLPYQLPQIIGGDWLIWILAVTGTLAAFAFRKLSLRRGTILAFVIFSVAAVCPGFYFREHYFILLLPAFAIAAAGTLACLAVNGRAHMAIAAAAFIAVALPLYHDRELLFRTAPVTASRSLYWPSPFAEAKGISDFVRNRTTDNDTIAVLGSEPEIYFDSRRRSATGYIYTYSLMEPQARASEMQREMISEIERSQPKLIVVIGADSSWLRRPTSDQTIFKWANDYCGANYTVAGLVNLVSPERSESFLPLNLSNPPSLANNYVLIYERRVATAP
jgi:hypothetical protein